MKKGLLEVEKERVNTITANITKKLQQVLQECVDSLLAFRDKFDVLNIVIYFIEEV